MVTDTPQEGFPRPNVEAGLQWEILVHPYLMRVHIHVLLPHLIFHKKHRVLTYPLRSAHVALNVGQLTVERLLKQKSSQVIRNAVKPTGGHNVDAGITGLFIIARGHSLHELVEKEREEEEEGEEEDKEGEEDKERMYDKMK